jgi:hypothetical protein
MKRLLVVLLSCLALAAPQARAELRGKTFMLLNPKAPRSEWQRAPLPGVYVAVFWEMTVPAPAHAVARSDETGEYLMQGPNFIAAALSHARHLSYSPGLEQIGFPAEGSPWTEKDITMTLSTADAQERLSRIAGLVDPHCPDTRLHDPQDLLGVYHRSLLEEARTLPVGSSQARSELRSIEEAAKRASGAQKTEPIRAVIVPSAGAVKNVPLPAGRP